MSGDPFNDSAAAGGASATQARETSSATGSEAASAAREAATATYDVVEGEQARSNFKTLLQDASRFVVEHPAEVVAASAGLLMGLLLPGRQRTQETAEPFVYHKEIIARRKRRGPQVAPVNEYIVSAPTGYRDAAARYVDRLRWLDTQSDLRILDTINENSDRLISMTEAEAEELKGRVPGLCIEPNLLYRKVRHPFLDAFEEIALPTRARKKTVAIRVVDYETGRGIPDVLVFLQLDSDFLAGVVDATDRNGIARFVTPREQTRYAGVFIEPQQGYWSRSLKAVRINENLDVELLPLPSAKSALYDWGHRFAQMSDELNVDAREIRIGIIDSGVSNEHPALSPVTGYNCVRGEDSSLWYVDDDGHGTHCAGIVAATVGKLGRGVKGYVPRAQICSYRVFAEGAASATSFDLALAIERAIADGCDIINMSLEHPTLHVSVRNKIESAFEQGVLCIAASGNDGSAVRYPAAFNLVMGVGAFGQFGAYPEDSLHVESESSRRSDDGEYYLANFSNFGSGVDFCAPGVAVLSAVPGGDYAAWDGTSVACPQVTGLAAIALAAHEELLRGPRDAARVETLIQILKSRSRKVGFGPSYEGSGCLTAPSLLVA